MNAELEGFSVYMLVPLSPLTSNMESNVMGGEDPLEIPLSLLPTCIRIVI